MNARTHNHIAVILSLVAALAFGAFHFLPLAVGGGKPIERCMGVDVWKDVWFWITNSKTLLEDPPLMAFLPAFALVSIGFVATPFIISLLARSRVLWWGYTVIWFIAAVAVVYEMIETYESIMFDYNGAVAMGSGLFALFLGLQAQLVALFFVRRSGERRSLGAVPS